MIHVSNVDNLYGDAKQPKSFASYDLCNRLFSRNKKNAYYDYIFQK